MTTDSAPPGPPKPTSPIGEAGDEEVVKLAHKAIEYGEMNRAGQARNGLYPGEVSALARAYLALRAHGRTPGEVS